jgi:hypothetical protein
VLLGEPQKFEEFRFPRSIRNYLTLCPTQFLKSNSVALIWSQLIDDVD